ncbi:MAG: transketolase family protein [Patescibacteria group bacterium]
MRIAFVTTLAEIARKNKWVMLLTGDLGFSVFEKFMAELPRQFLNMGVAEQNMTGVAAGLAMEGKIPIIFSIVPFATMRNFEQIRNDICYQNLNVKIVGVGAGFSYGPYGHTHHGLEDMGILRTLPNLVILAPGDPLEVKLATRAMLKYRGPVYLRLGKAGEPNVHLVAPIFTIGRGIVIREGKDISLLATSTLLYRGREVADSLENRGVKVRLVSMPTLKPLDGELIKECVKKTRAIFTLEEHSVIGGLGSAVAEALAEYGKPVIFKRLGVPDRFTKVIGNQEYMRRANQLAAEQIVVTIRKAIAK